MNIGRDRDANAVGSMTELRTLIRENHQRLSEVLGEARLRGRQGVETAIEPDVADEAVAGRLYFKHEGKGRLPIETGLRGIDWAGGHHEHQEWRAQLNRFFQLPSLVGQWQRTGEPRYAEAARAYIEDWIAAHPVSDEGASACAAYDNALNLAIRVTHWLAALAVFVDDDAHFDDALLQRIIASACAQLDHLTVAMRPQGNQRIFAADALLMSGLRLDGHERCVKWREIGIRALNDAYFRQVLPDGAHRERTPGYHVAMLMRFEAHWQLERAMPGLGLAVSADALGKMHDYAVAASRPNGDFNAMHDCVGRRTGPADERRLAARAAFRQEAGLPEGDPPVIAYFPHAGQALWRDGWRADATYLTFDATPWAGSHTHLSRNAVQLHAHGRSLLVDPGTLSYERSDPLCVHGRMTRAHNTLNLNGMSQAPTDPVRTRHETVGDYALVSSLCGGGYWPGRYHWTYFEGHGQGLYGEHHRILLWLKGRFALVIDQFYTGGRVDGGPTLESNWQLCEGGVEVSADGGRAVTDHEDANLLMLFALKPGGTKLSVHEGENDPPAGWLPGDQGDYVAAPQLRQSVSTTGSRSFSFATVLIPFAGCTAPGLTVEDARLPEIDGVGHVALRWDDGTRDTFWWTSRGETAINTCDGITTDAGLLHLCHSKAGEARGGLAVDGTYVDPVLAQPREIPGVFAL